MFHQQTSLFTSRFWWKVIVMTLIFLCILFAIRPPTLPSPSHTDHMDDRLLKSPREKKWPTQDIQDAQSIENTIETMSLEILSNTHNAPNKAGLKLEQLCWLYSDLCNKTSREGSYDETELLTYQLLMIYLIKQMDQRLTSDTTVRTTLSVLKHFQDSQWRRWSAWHTNIKLNTEKILSYQEYWEVLTHELGHIIDLGVVQGTTRSKDTFFTEFGQVQWAIDDPSLNFYSVSRQAENIRKKQASFKDFVSGYAMQWVYEDFAESLNMYFNHHALFVKLAQENSALQAKYTFIQDLMGGKYFREDTHNVASLTSESRPWDTTKIGLN
jgi:hypothetical protein